MTVRAQVEIACFDVIREQKKVTTENSGATQLLKLLGKAWDLNLPPLRRSKALQGGPGSAKLRGHVGGLSVGLSDAHRPAAAALEASAADREVEMADELADRMKVTLNLTASSLPSPRVLPTP
jgi:hypothetical protein